MPPTFHPTSVAMKDDAGNRGGRFGWALPASLGLHLVVAALLVLELPISLPEPQEEQAIAVDLVPPPEEAQPESPPPPPEPEKPEPEQAETQSPANAEEAPRAAAPVLNPVFQFGERDAGPRQALDGDSAEEGAEKPPSDTDRPVEAEAQPETPVAADDQPTPVERPTPAEPEEQAPPAEPEEQAPSAEAAETGDPKPAETAGDGADDAQALPETLRSADALAAAEQSASPSDGAQAQAEPEPEPEVQVSLPATSRAPTPRPANPARTPSSPALQEARRLFSQSATGDQTATTARSDLPREVRGGRLCVTEMREQLRNASPPYFPDLLPSYPMKSGTTLEVSDAAFRVRGLWFNLSFRCTVDADATKVVSFAFRVGGAIPRSQWARRELPSQ